jgi:hypothetical protein
MKAAPSVSSSDGSESWIALIPEQLVADTPALTNHESVSTRPVSVIQTQSSTAVSAYVSFCEYLARRADRSNRHAFAAARN